MDAPVVVACPPDNGDFRRVYCVVRSPNVSYLGAFFLGQQEGDPEIEWYVRRRDDHGVCAIVAGPFTDLEEGKAVLLAMYHLEGKT